MIHKVFNYFSDSLPVVGGTIGAVSQVEATVWFPSLSTFVYTGLIAVVGAALGYLVKLFLDSIFKRKYNDYN